MIGILAYGSLINDPKDEIEAALKDRKKVSTPFAVEYARYSKTRGGAPTLVCVESGGSQVNAELFILNEDVTLKDAVDMLWRRETYKVCKRLSYKRPNKPNQKSVLIESCDNFKEVDIALFTDFYPSGKITDPQPKELAEKAIASVKTAPNEKDGITYLINAKENDIITPLTPEYERQILIKTNSITLKKALDKLIRKRSI